MFRFPTMQQLSRPCRGRLPRPAPSCWGGHGRVWGAGRPHRALATDVLELLESGDDDDHKALYCYGASLGRQLKDTFSCLQEDELDVVLAGLRGCILNEPPLQVIRHIGAEGLDRRGPAGSCRLFLGPGFRLGARWNRLVETVKTRKKRGKMGDMV